MYCKGPTRSIWRWANYRREMGMGCGRRQVLPWILPCWQCMQDLAQLVMSLESPSQTNLEDVRWREASLPGWEILCKCKKTFFSEFCWDNGVENSRWNIAIQALSACLSKHNFERWTAEQNLHIYAMILLSSHGFEVNWICHRCDGNSSRCLRWREGRAKKIGNNIFQTGQIQHLHIEFRNLKPNGGAATVKWG